jgi:hypothetical protein
VVVGDEQDLAEDVGHLGTEDRVDLRGREPLRPRLPPAHQVRLRQFADLLVQLEDLPVAVAGDAESSGVGLGDVLDLGDEFAEIHRPTIPEATRNAVEPPQENCELPDAAGPAPSPPASRASQDHTRTPVRRTRLRRTRLLQVCSDDPVPLPYAVRRLVRDARTFTSVRWTQRGFNPAPGSEPGLAVPSR